MIEEVARAIATADSARFENDAARYRKLALAALKRVAKPTETMVDAACEAARFDEHWAVNSRRDFRKGVRAMILAAIEEHGQCPSSGRVVQTGVRPSLTRK
jgi:hypothetical protein